MISNSLNETKIAAKELLQMLISHSDRATVLLLEGELGAGKTTFVQGLADALHVGQYTTSPTFVLEKRYRLSEDGPFSQLVHIDAYRLEGKEAASALEMDELLKTPNTLIAIEWPENLELALPEDATRVRLTHEGGDKRGIEIQS